MHFARTLRAAGLPVGPGKVLDAVAAVRGGRDQQPRAISTGRCTRSSSTAATSASCSTRRSTSSGAIPSCSKKMLALMLPEMSVELPAGRGRGDDPPPRRGAAPRPARRAETRGDRARTRRGDDLLRPRSAARDGFREDVAATSWRAAKAAIARHDAAGGSTCRRAASRPTRAAPAPTCARPCAPRCARAASSR